MHEAQTLCNRLVLRLSYPLPPPLRPLNQRQEIHSALGSQLTADLKTRNLAIGYIGTKGLKFAGQS